MKEEDEDNEISARRETAIQQSGKGLQDLLIRLNTKEDRQLERLEDVERLTDIIHAHRVKRARSKEIACAIIRFVKEE
ncbi:MAG: hypothetical protein H6Q80_1653 [Deltaproteobacteria bacterium]|nr:hypothetical protein [Deltaproteobacteria bacterium]